MKTAALFLMGLFMLVSSAAAAETFRTITADELKKLIDGGQKITLVDSRTEDEFRQGHLPKAMNIPPEKVIAIGALLPKARNSAVIFYCRGVSWGLSKQAAVAAEKAGYTNIQIFQGGYPEWTAKGYKTITK